MKKKDNSTVVGAVGLISKVPPTVGCDQWAWITQDIHHAIEMGVKLNSCRKVGADEPLIKFGISGIAEGCAGEVVQILGMLPYKQKKVLPSIHDNTVDCSKETTIKEKKDE